MPSDNVSRSEAKAKVKALITEEFDDSRGCSLDDYHDRDKFRQLVVVQALAAIDALPAAGEEREGQFQTAWRELYNWLWDAPEVKSASRVIDLMGRIEQRRELPEDISAPAPDRPEKPPMLYATVVGLTAKEQPWTRCGNVWQLVGGEERIASKRFQGVCVYKSAPEALQLFHEDLRK